MVRMTKKGEVEHPAKFSTAILDVMDREIRAAMLREKWDHVTVMDPFAGVGLIHLLKTPTIHTHGIELEPEWCEVAATRGPTVCMDMLKFVTQLPFNIVATSITYGNRMADDHTPGELDMSRRNTYRHVLERPLTEGTSANLQWGEKYREFHTMAFEKMKAMLCNHGYIILNTKDHVRDGVVQPMTQWTRKTIMGLGFEIVTCVQVPTTGNGMGQNGQSRVGYEWVHVYQLKEGE